METACVLGVDVGGTNTDAVLLRGNQVLAFSKHTTTADITSGLLGAVVSVLKKASQKCPEVVSIRQVNVGTTHFVNAVVQNSSQLCRVAAIRLATPPRTEATPPFSDFPKRLKQTICGGWELISGGNEFDGRELGPLNEQEVVGTVQKFVNLGIRNFAVSGVFSPVTSVHECAVETILKKHFPECSVSLSHQLGQIGLLERENATILNESLKPLAKKVITGLQTALQKKLGLTCPLYLAQNDGTICSFKQALQYPIVTFASGPTNSMRGAAFLSGLRNVIVVDIGGTSTDVGVLADGFPRQASSTIEIAGVPTNFRMPNTLSIALGGGSLVQMVSANKCTVGPKSVGYRLEQEALCFGGNVITATDVAVAAGLVPDIDKEKTNLDSQIKDCALLNIRDMVENAIDKMKTSADAVDVLFVGGGSILVDTSKPLVGCNRCLTVEYFSVANAIGAALCQVSGLVDSVATIEPGSELARSAAIALAKKSAAEKAVKNGAEETTVKIVEVEELPLTYLPGNAVRLKVKAVGDLCESVQNIALSEINADFTSDVENLLFDSIEENEDQSTNKHLAAANPWCSEETYAMDDLVNSISPDCCTDGKEIWTLTGGDVECISVGAGILGCGGGGNPHIGKLKALNLLAQGRKPMVVSLNWLTKHGNTEGYVYPVAMMGAPLVLYEKLPSGKETADAASLINCFLNKLPFLEKLKHDEWHMGGVFLADHIKFDPEMNSYTNWSKSCSAVIAAEIGGVNSMEPLCLSASFDLLCLDADGMGRAFPELQMFAPSIYGLTLCPASQASDGGRYTLAFKANSPKKLEDCFREICVQNGCSSGVAMALMPVSKVENLCVLGSVSRCWRLGKALLLAKQQESSSIEAILSCENGKMLCKGKIVDVQRRLVAGFTRGNVIINGVDEYADTNLKVDFQNENLVVWNLNKAIATVPDLICILDMDSGRSIPTEELRYGLRITLLVLPPSPLLVSETALKVVGPEAFGYENLTYNSALF